MGSNTNFLFSMYKLFYLNYCNKLEIPLPSSANLGTWNALQGSGTPIAPLIQISLHKRMLFRTEHGDFTWYHRKLKYQDAAVEKPRYSPIHPFIIRPYHSAAFMVWPDQWQKGALSKSRKSLGI